MKYSQISLKGNGLVITVVLALVVGAVATLFVLGMSKENQNTANNSSNGLCDGLVTEYNTAFTQNSVDGYAAKLANSAKAAAAVKDNQTDPNCVFIQFTNAMYTTNVDDTAKFAATLKTLASEGKYITGQLGNPLSLKAIEENATLITAPDSISPTSSLKGNG